MLPLDLPHSYEWLWFFIQASCWSHHSLTLTLQPLQPKSCSVTASAMTHIHRPSSQNEMRNDRIHWWASVMLLFHVIFSSSASSVSKACLLVCNKAWERHRRTTCLCFYLSLSWLKFQGLMRSARCHSRVFGLVWFFLLFTSRSPGSVIPDSPHLLTLP